MATLMNIAISLLLVIRMVLGMVMALALAPALALSQDPALPSPRTSIFSRPLTLEKSASRMRDFNPQKKSSPTSRKIMTDPRASMNIPTTTSLTRSPKSRRGKVSALAVARSRTRMSTLSTRTSRLMRNSLRWIRAISTRACLLKPPGIILATLKMSRP